MAGYVRDIIVGFWGTLAEMSPYLLFGFLVAGLLSVFLSQRFIEKHLGGRGVWPLLKASAFGVPLPLCSCGVIPVSVSLHKHGASKGATIAFLLSTPQTGVDSIFVTLSLLGPVFAVFRPVAALVTGIVGGVLTNVVDRQANEAEPVTEECADSCCRASRSSPLLRALRHGFVTLPRDIGKVMLVGLLLAGVISAAVPEGFFAEHLGSGILPLVVMMFLGIPVYVCATASVPVAAALILKGLSPGAALVFLMTGPATNAAGFVTIWKALGRRAALAYIGSVAGCALLAGLALDAIVQSTEVGIGATMGWMLPEPVKQVCGIVLVGVLSQAVIRRTKHA